MEATPSPTVSVGPRSPCSWKGLPAPPSPCRDRVTPPSPWDWSWSPTSVTRRSPTAVPPPSCSPGGTVVRSRTAMVMTCSAAASSTPPACSPLGPTWARVLTPSPSSASATGPTATTTTAGTATTRTASPSPPQALRPPRDSSTPPTSAAAAGERWPVGSTGTTTASLTPPRRAVRPPVTAGAMPHCVGPSPRTSCAALTGRPDPSPTPTYG